MKGAAMEAKGPLIARPPQIRHIDSVNDQESSAGDTMATRDHSVIQRWASRYQAQPATGEQTASGPSSSLHVTDGGAGIRFNLPGAAHFRPIEWEEWFQNFDEHGLTLVYEHADVGSVAMPRYRLVKTEEWKDQL
jgi:hypothetical protein